MRWLVLLAAVAVGGCATDVGPSQAELKAQWEAQNVYPQNYKSDLMAFLRTYLNDPTHVRNASVSQPQLKHGRAGRAICRVRALQRAQERRQICRHQRGRRDLCVGKARPLLRARRRKCEEFCKDAAYEPFPELEALAR